VRIRSQEEAIAAYLATQSGVIPEGYSVTANCVMDLSFILEDGTCLWSVGLKPDDTEGGVTGGYRTFIGPDGKLWRFPSSPLCDRDIAVSALTHLYLEGVADLVDPKGTRRPSDAHHRATGRSNLRSARCSSPGGASADGRRSITSSPARS
jgi:hypothetical protein